MGKFELSLFIEETCRYVAEGTSPNNGINQNTKITWYSQRGIPTLFENMEIDTLENSVKRLTKLGKSHYEGCCFDISDMKVEVHRIKESMS